MTPEQFSGRLPTDAEIINALGSGRCMTYVARNVLSRQYDGLKTSWVLRQLKRLEKSGKVRRVPSVYRVQIAWAVVARAA